MQLLLAHDCLISLSAWLAGFWRLLIILAGKALKSASAHNKCDKALSLALVSQQSLGMIVDGGDDNDDDDDDEDAKVYANLIWN